MDDRIDALLADVEAMHTSAQAHARRGELGEEILVQSFERTLVERLRGSLGQTIQLRVGGREIVGAAVFLGRDIIVIDGHEISIVTLTAIDEFRVRTRRHDQVAGSLERLGMASALRRLAAEHEEISLTLAGGGGVVRGCSDMVAADYVEISGRLIAHRVIAYVQTRVNPFG